MAESNHPAIVLLLAFSTDNKTRQFAERKRKTGLSMSLDLGWY